MMATFLNTREWADRPGADAVGLGKLRSLLPMQVPGAYLELLALSDGGEGPLPVPPFNARIDDVATMLGNLGASWHKTWLQQGFFVVGGNGGGELIAFDLRMPGVPPLVFVEMVAGAESAEVCASSWAEFVKMLGVPAAD